MYLRRVLTIAILVFFATELIIASGGSAYSRFGVGERHHLMSIRSIGMGGTAVALRGSNHINIANPAAWSDLPVVQFSGSLFYESISFNDGTNTGGISTGSINSAMLALPVMPSHGMTVTLGFAPMTQIGYNIQTRRDIEDGFQQIQHRGSGGITNLMIGSSYRLHRNFAVGATALYRMGILQYEWSTQYSLPGFNSGFTQRELDVDGIAGQFGLLYSGLLPARRENRPGPLTVGLVFLTPSKLDTDENFLISYGIGIDTTTTRSGTIELPSMLGMGVSYQIDQRNLISIDARYEPWEDFRRFGNPDPQLRNSLRLGFGWERQGRYDEIGVNFWNRTTWRFGFIYNASYFNINDNPINESFVTLGMGIPLSGIAILDIGAQIGVRGTTDNNLQRDTMVRLFFSLNMFERWFVPPVIE